MYIRFNETNGRGERGQSMRLVQGSKAKPQFLVVLDCLGSSRAMDLTLTIKESEKDARKRPRELRRQNAKPEKPV